MSEVSLTVFSKTEVNIIVSKDCAAGFIQHGAQTKTISHNAKQHNVNFTVSKVKCHRGS